MSEKHFLCSLCRYALQNQLLKYLLKNLDRNHYSSQKKKAINEKFLKKKKIGEW
jgi:hypothetical protein